MILKAMILASLLFAVCESFGQEVPIRGEGKILQELNAREVERYTMQREMEAKISEVARMHYLRAAFYTSFLLSIKKHGILLLGRTS